MVSTVQEPAVAYQKKVKIANRKPLSYARFQKQYLNRDDRFKYEWVKGFVIISPHTVEKYQFFIMRNLRNFFSELIKTNQVTGYLESEFNLFFGVMPTGNPTFFILPKNKPMLHLWAKIRFLNLLSKLFQQLTNSTIWLIK